MPAALATFRYPAAWSATLAWALSPLGLSSTGNAWGFISVANQANYDTAYAPLLSG